ncbi:MAG: GNAT family N-acetyltransferase [Woeseia sp.]|nr:GNAT family N-acetyltransferase [Woeseia sp.]
MTALRKEPSEVIDQKGEIRACKPADLEAVTALFSETFSSYDANYNGDLQGYLRQVYFENPWMDDAMPSLVYEQDGAVVGFLGVVPRQMSYRGKSIQAAVSSALMVRRSSSGQRNPLQGVALMRRFLKGPQDLSLTDTANESSRRLWTGCGGDVAYAYSYSWTRPLQPLATMMELGGYGDGNLGSKIVKPFVRVVDGALGRMRGLRPGKPEHVAEEIDTETLLELIQSVSSYSLVPQYDLQSLRWLIGMAEQSPDEGRLAKRCVRDSAGKVLGWYVYYETKGKLARVLQLAGHPHSMRDVLNALVHDAMQAGAAALWGRTEPRYASFLHDQKCIFFANPWVLVQAKNPELVACFREADAFFSGFEGELWMQVNA